MDGQKLLPLVELESIERRHGLDTGVRDKNIHFSECGDRLGNEGIHLVFIGDIHGDPNRVSLTAEFVGDRIRLLFAVVGNRHARTFVRNELGNLLADAARRSGDDGDLVIETHGPSPVLRVQRR